MRSFVLCLPLCALVSLPAVAAPPLPPHAGTSRAEVRTPVPGPALPSGARWIDNSTRIDVNQISMPVTNTGSIAYDKTTGNAGLEYPAGSGHTAVFAAGLWLGARVGGQPRVAISEYSDEFQPGAIVNGLPDDPGKYEYHVYKLKKSYASGGDPYADLAEYNSGAVPHGAPSVGFAPDGSLDILGDQMLWCVFNDADASAHTNRAGSTAPLGVEVQLTAFAFTTPGPLDHTVFLRYRIINKGSNLLQDFRIGMWADPDLGYMADDLTGCDPERSLGFTYNAPGSDLQYGSSPPAVGFDLLRGPIGPTGLPMPMTAFQSYVNGTDPASYLTTYHALSGLDAAGQPVVDPVTGLPTAFWFPGDPVYGVGWVDPRSADKRLLVASRGADLAPGQEQWITFAILVSQGANRLASIQSLRCDDDRVQQFFEQDFAPPGPSPETCALATPLNCPSSAEEWYLDCQPGSARFTSAQIGELAARVDAASLTFDWGGSPVSGLLATLAPPGPLTSRTHALKEYAAFLCNYVASMAPAIVPGSGLPAYLDPGTPVSCASAPVAWLYELAASARYGLAAAEYLDAGPNPAALAGVNNVLPFFGGGAGYAADFLGSSIPSGWAGAHSVEVRFTEEAAGQYAYRYLRTLDAYGNRVYMIQDYVRVPWTLWDLDTNTQLNGAFLENAGPPPAANLDGHWDPNDSADGGREYLWVMDSPYSGDATPNSAYFTDPTLMDALLGQVDFRYVLTARRVAAGAVIDSGDRFRFTWGVAGSGADSQLLRLAALAPDDPSAAQSYDDLAACLMAINAGIGIGTTCYSATATLASLVNADASSDRVTLTWHLGGTPASELRIERAASRGSWHDLGRVLPNGTGMVNYEDRDVVTGTEYSYRLRISNGGAISYAGEVTLSVPLRSVLALQGFRPNPAGARLQVAFSLTSAAPAQLTIFDVAGRRCFSSPVGAMGAGFHLLPLPNSLESGLYMVRLEQGGQLVRQKAVVVR